MSTTTTAAQTYGQTYGLRADHPFLSSISPKTTVYTGTPPPSLINWAAASTSTLASPSASSPTCAIGKIFGFTLCHKTKTKTKSKEPKLAALSQADPEMRFGGDFGAWSPSHGYMDFTPSHLSSAPPEYYEVVSPMSATSSLPVTPTTPHLPLLSWSSLPTLVHSQTEQSPLPSSKSRAERRKCQIYAKAAAVVQEMTSMFTEEDDREMMAQLRRMGIV